MLALSDDRCIMERENNKAVRASEHMLQVHHARQSNTRGERSAMSLPGQMVSCVASAGRFRD